MKIVKAKETMSARERVERTFRSNRATQSVETAATRIAIIRVGAPFAVVQVFDAKKPSRAPRDRRQLLRNRNDAVRSQEMVQLFLRRRVPRRRNAKNSKRRLDRTT